MKTKVDALSEIIRASRSTRMSATELKRLRRAGKALGFDEKTQIWLEYLLEYRNIDLSIRQAWKDVK